MVDVVIVGAGPAGFSATLGAMERKLRFVTVEQDTFGGMVAHYPRGKLVMAGTAHLPMVGKVSLRRHEQGEAARLLGEGAARYGRADQLQGTRGRGRPGGQGLPRADQRAGNPDPQCAAGDRPAGHAAPARRARGRPDQGHLQAHRARAIQQPPGADRRRRRQRARGRHLHQRRSPARAWRCPIARRPSTASRPPTGNACARRRRPARSRS